MDQDLGTRNWKPTPHNGMLGHTQPPMGLTTSVSLQADEA
jgi:hypothetical protein